jgi:hypothetical protein
MSLIERAAKTIGLRQRSYQGMFAEGAPYHHVLSELALYARAFSADDDNLSRDDLMKMHGRRQMFFMILNHLKLSTAEIEGIYISLAARNSARPPFPQGDIDG